MVSLPNTALQPIGTIYSMPIVDIDFGKRLRPVDPVWAEALGRIIAQEGQQTPIQVCRRRGKGDFTWTLVAGAHRLEGCRLEGLAYIKATVLDDAPAIDRKMQEVSENLWRKGLDPLDRAAFVAELHQLLRARAGVAADASPQSVAINARWQKRNKVDAADTSAIVADVYGWTDDIAAQLGLSKRSIEYDLTLHRRLPAGIVEQLRRHRHPVLGNAAQLRALAKLDEPDQRRVANLLTCEVTNIGGLPPKSVGEAISRIRNRLESDAEAKRLSAFVGAYQRMGLAEKKGALAHLAELLPAGFQLITAEQAA